MNCALCQDYFFCNQVMKHSRNFYTDPVKINCSHYFERKYELKKINQINMNLNKTYKRLKQWIKDCLYPKKITPKMFIVVDKKHKPQGKRILAEISWGDGEPYYDILHWMDFVDLKHQEGWYDSTAEDVPSACIKSYIEF